MFLSVALMALAILAFSLFMAHLPKASDPSEPSDDPGPQPVRYDFDTAKEYIRQINEVLPNEPKELLNITLALEAMMLSRARLLNSLSSEQDKGKIEKTIIDCLKKAEDLDFKPYLKQ